MIFNNKTLVAAFAIAVTLVQVSALPVAAPNAAPDAAPEPAQIPWKYMVRQNCLERASKKS